MRIVSVALLLAMAGCSVATTPPVTPDPSPMAISNAVIGQTYPLQVLTYCGLRGTRINGEWWSFTDPTVDSDGLLTPWDIGSITLADDSHATWTGSDGKERSLTRGGEAPPTCY